MPLTTESTTFTKDVLGRYTCSTWDEATSNPEGIDVVILGAGLYGGYLASKVYELAKERIGKGNKFDGLRVLVLEAGPYTVPEHTANIPNLGFTDPFGDGKVDVGPGTNPGTRKEVWGVGWRSNEPFVGQAYCVGGKGIFWGGWCPRLQPKDLEQWPEEIRKYLTEVSPADPVGTRPIDHKDLATGATLKRGEPLTGYEALEYEIGVLPSDDFVFDPLQLATSDKKLVGLNEALRVFLTQEIGNINAPTPGRGVTDVLPGPIAVQTQSFVSGLFALDKYSSVPALTSSVRDDHADGRESNLRMALVSNCHAARFGFRGDNEAQERGTRVVDRIDVIVNGAKKSLFLQPHCQVVLAMSAIESTRLALESFSLAGSGLRADDDELIGRNFMIHLRCDIALDIDKAQFAAWVALRWPNHQLADVLQQATIHVQCDGPNGRYQYQLFAASNSDGPDPNMYQMVPDLDIQRRIADGFRSDKIRVILRASGEVIGGRDKPYRDAGFDYIDLAKSGDYDLQNDHFRAWVQFNRGNHAADPIWKDMHDTGHAIASTLGGPLLPDYRGGNFNLNALIAQQGVGTTFHDAGTLWMGENPDESVTDVNGHFHHVTNVYCADQGLFTTVGSANPALTGMVLARKVAGDIVGRHSGYTTPSALPGLVPQSLSDTAGWLQVPNNGMFVYDGGGLIETRPIGGKIGLYFLPESLGDFDLAIDWKSFRTSFDGSNLIANSGILLRTPDPRTVNFNDQAQFDAFYAAATEIQIDETGKRYSRATGRSVFGDSRYKTGAIYEVAPAIRWAANVASPDGPNLGDRYWNIYEISARGRNIRVVLNGKLVCQADIPTSKNLKGFLGLQFHTGRLQFRNLRLRRIS